MLIVLMGVTASGKTTVGRMLAQELNWTFYDADDFHPPANIDKMRQGLPLTDADRLPWLEALHEQVRRCLAEGQDAVLACSALKAAYRRYLLIDRQVKLSYLKADEELIRTRLQERRAHFMHPTLLASQFETLEEPACGVILDASLSPQALVRVIRRALSL